MERVTDTGPSAGKLQVGDAIDAVDGTPVAERGAVHRIAQGRPSPARRWCVDYRRKNAPTGHRDDHAWAPTRTGTTASSASACVDAPWAPFTIDFNLANIGGPSAGLMFSLAVVDKLTTGDLNGGKFVAGTGTINADGKVGPIGGITHKMLAAQEAGATVFLVPAENCDEAKSAHEDGIELVKVENLGRRGRRAEGAFCRWRSAHC